MRRTILATFLSLAVASASVPWATHAVAQAMDADTKEAKSLFEEGVKLYKAGNFESARVKFKAAYGLKKRPSILLNLARAEQQTKRYAEASAHYREVLTLADAKPEDKEEAKVGVADMRKMIGFLLIEAPPGSTVSVDGEPRGSTPFEGGLEVSAGPHAIIIKSTGGQLNEAITVAAGASATVRWKGVTDPVKPDPKPDPKPEPTPDPKPDSKDEPKPDPKPDPKDEPTPEPTKTSFFRSIHPVTYVAAGTTVLSGILWISFYVQAGVNDDNAAQYLEAIRKNPTSAKVPGYREEGRAEADSASSKYTISTVFGVVTALAAGATVVTFVMMRKKDTAAPAVGFTAAPMLGGGGAFAVFGSF